MGMICSSEPASGKNSMASNESARCWASVISTTTFFLLPGFLFRYKTQFQLFAQMDAIGGNSRAMAVSDRATDDQEQQNSAGLMAGTAAKIQKSEGRSGHDLGQSFQSEVTNYFDSFEEPSTKRHRSFMPESRSSFFDLIYQLFTILRQRGIPLL